MTTAAISAPASLDPKLIVPLVNSIKAVFSTMVKVEVAIGRPSVKSTATPSYDVSGIIGLSGDLIGSIVVSFQMDAAAKLVSAFAGTPLDPKGPDFPDAVGELANMIAGGAKKAFGVMANITVPNVIIGTGHMIARLSDVPCVIIPCKTAVGDFAVEVNIKQVGCKGGL
ncbi:MAG TPA: chemotaxis protein CheX [Tepidisphaeraceae bacterium]|nr:chemotaxis protein CheX [Tepidisphaeraceae bacterium]